MSPNFLHLKDAFSRMSESGYDTHRPLRWGYSFFDPHKDRLEKLSDELTGFMFNLEGIDMMEDQGCWRLYVTRVETLSPLQLHVRNIDFNHLAHKYIIDAYDGWDVEKC